MPRHERMRLHRVLRHQMPSSGRRLPWTILGFALMFALGAIAGAAAAGKTAENCGEELLAYLRAYLQIDADGTQTLLPVWFAYVRYPLLAFLLGFSSIGVLALPLLSLCQGFFFAYAVYCFAGALGRGVFLLILIAFLLRGSLMLPATLLLQGAAWRSSASLAAVSFGQGKRQAVISYHRKEYGMCLLCSIVLTLGAVLEWLFLPQLLQTMVQYLAL